MSGFISPPWVTADNHAEIIRQEAAKDRKATARPCPHPTYSLSSLNLAEYFILAKSSWTAIPGINYGPSRIGSS